jgi:hypothetical protein
VFCQAHDPQVLQALNLHTVVAAVHHDAAQPQQQFMLISRLDGRARQVVEQAIDPLLNIPYTHMVQSFAPDADAESGFQIMDEITFHLTDIVFMYMLITSLHNV